ncbi:MAG: stalk domain-containing protein [Defluviitaleaceae bacterium]|nr:stalk domain-containing protein [Defluviitaleaceae bacterium]
MKKLLTFIIFVAAFYSQVYAAPSPISVTVDGEAINFDQAPVIVDGRTLVPLRAVFEHVGFDVEWEPTIETATLDRDDFTVVISIGSPTFTTNGSVIPLEVPAQIIAGRTLLPIRAVLESVGYFVGWDATANTVVVASGGHAAAPGAGFVNGQIPLLDPLPPPVRETTIPNRRLTEPEITDWINAYHAMGGGNDFEREVIRLTNLERIAAGLLPLEEYAPLMMAARFKSQSMYDLSYFSHTSPVYGHFANISREVFGLPVRSMGENLASGHRHPEDVVTGWMESQGHRENILNPIYTRIGVGFYNNRWTQKFSS